MEVLARAITKGKETKCIHIGKEEVKVYLFADDMILYVENPKEYTKKLLELTSSASVLSRVLQRNRTNRMCATNIAERN